MQKDSKNLVEVCKAYKRYDSNNVVLRGLNMTVENGTIYGLLGASGCGKTTLLSCITGHHSLDSGSISLHLESKKQLGYMPQDIALIELFTVSEMFHYFGKVNGLSSAEVVTRGHELLQLMELPAHVYWERLVGSLSGGQRKRISLTVALLHDPSLLILDEPTAGLDPLINQRLWQYFTKITEENGKTIIITTHYIEEAKNAHMVGLMRNGLLLAENPPLQLIAEYECDALEDVFLILSQKQNSNCIENDEEYPKETLVEAPIKADTLWNPSRMEAQVYKNLCWAKRNIPMMLFILLLPAVQMTLFCFVFSDTLHGVKIAVVSHEILPDSCLHPRDSNAALPLCDSQSQFSCQYLKLIEDKNYTIVEYSDFKSAYQAVVEKEAYALLHFDKYYSGALLGRLSEGVTALDDYVNNSMVSAYVDMAEMTIGYKIKKDIIDSFKELVELIFSNCEYNPKAAHELIKFETPVYGDMAPKYTHTALGGFIIPLAFYMAAFFSSSSISSEKISGFLERSLVSGVRQTEIVFAHIVMQFLLMIGQNITMLGIAYGIFNLPLKGSWLLIIFFVVLAEIQGMFYGFFLGTLFDQERNITYSCTGSIYFLFLVCGMFWPVEGMHWFIRSIIRHFPVQMAVESYQSIAIRGWGLSNTSVLESVAANITFTVILMCMYITVCKIKK